MSTLHDRLAELADDAPAAGQLPGDLWQRGRRIARVRRAGTAVVVLAACVALVIVWAGAWSRARTSVEPAEPGTTAAIPATLYAPSRWLPGTSGHPIGPLAGVLEAVRGRNVGLAPVGISALTGEYRFLDLPGSASHDDAVLSRTGARWPTG
jgi:hypothetical protein